MDSGSSSISMLRRCLNSRPLSPIDETIGGEHSLQERTGAPATLGETPPDRHTRAAESRGKMLGCALLENDPGTHGFGCGCRTGISQTARTGFRYGGSGGSLRSRPGPAPRDGGQRPHRPASDSDRMHPIWRRASPACFGLGIARTSPPIRSASSLSVSPEARALVRPRIDRLAGHSRSPLRTSPAHPEPFAGIHLHP